MDNQNRKFKNIVQQAPVGITILRGADLVVEMANETYLLIVDRTEQEFVGRPLYDSLPEVKDRVAPLLEKVLQTGIPYHGFEFPVFLNRYGLKELTYFNFVYQALKEENGEISGIIVVANEVTETVKAKQSLEENGRQFRNMVMQSPIAMTIFRGQELVIEMANQILLKNIWRKTEEEVIGKKVLDVFPELREQKYPELLYRVLNTGISHQEKESLALVEGNDGLKTFYLDYEYAPLKDNEGKVTGIMITVNDVTEKVEARRHVEDTKERLRLATEAAGLATWDLDLTTRNIIHSPRLSEIFGYAPSVLLSHQQMRAHLVPEDFENIAGKAFDHALETGSFSYEARVIKADGSICWINNRGTVFYDEAHRPVKMIGALRDITEEKAFSQELERLVRERTMELAVKNEELVKMNADLKSFAYVSSHDLQEPLRKIQAFASRIAEMERDNLSEKGLDYFGRIQRSAATMQTLIQDLLAYARTSSNEKVFEYTPIKKVLQEAEDELRDLIEQKKAVIKTTDLGTASIIPFQFRQLLINLVGNSLKFAKTGELPLIELKHNRVRGADIGVKTLQPELTYYHLQITDNGIGFDPAYKEKIFEIFQRLNSKDVYKGTGIGLAIVKRIVDNHHGYITADGEVNNGARFDIYIPELPAGK